MPPKPAPTMTTRGRPGVPAIGSGGPAARPRLGLLGRLRRRLAAALERLDHESALLREVALVGAGRGARAPRPSRVAEGAVSRQALSRALAEEGPGPHVPRLLLRPDDVRGRAVPGEDRAHLLGGVGVELLDPDDRGVADP